MPYDYPRRPEGRDARDDVRRLWEDVFKIVENLRLMEEALRKETEKKG